MYTQEDIRIIIKRFVSLVSEEFPIREAYLFGSYAHGNADNYSDIDLAIVSDLFEGFRFEDKQKINKYILKTSIDLEVHPFKTDDFNTDNPFVNEIIKTGIKVA